MSQLLSTVNNIVNLGGCRRSTIARFRSMSHRVPPTTTPVGSPATPSADELDAQFAAFVKELDLSPEKTAVLLNFDSARKWQLLQEHNVLQDQGSKLSGVAHYVCHLKLTCKELQSPHHLSSHALLHLLTELDSLKIALKTKPISFVRDFVQMRGTELLMTVVDHFSRGREDIMVAALGSLRSLLGNSNGQYYVLQNEGVITQIALAAIETKSVKAKSTALEMLGALCVFPTGHRAVLNSFSTLREHLGERSRFQLLVVDLFLSKRDKESVVLKTSILSLVNAILSYGECKENFAVRMHLRMEFLALGVGTVMEKLISHEHNVLSKHVEIFEMSRDEDESIFSSSLANGIADPNSIDDIFEAIKERLMPSDARTHFLAILQHLSLLPGDKRGTRLWDLLSQITQQAVLQHTDGHDPDRRALELDFGATAEQAELEKELERAQEEVEQLKRSLKSAQDELHVGGHVKLRSSESDDQHSVSSGVESVETGSSSHSRQNSTHNVDSICGMSRRDGSLDNERQSRSSGPCFPVSTFIPPPPPLPTPSAVEPKIKRNIPKPSKQMRTLNWSKIPESNICETVWAELSDGNLYKIIDLEELEQHFAACQRAITESDELPEDVHDRTSIGGPIRKSFSVLDGRRAQNLQILLSRYKVRGVIDIRPAVMTLDMNCMLSKDFVEQLYKFVPTSTELNSLNEAADQVHLFTAADKFLLDLSRIPGFRNKMDCLYYKKKFAERVNEIEPKIDAILKASRSVSHSKRLKKLLQLVLACGNYMNYGKPSREASGFYMTALLEIAGTRSAIRKDYTLMHYLAQMAEQKLPELLRLRRELSAVNDAAKISLEDLASDVESLTMGQGQLREFIASQEGDQTRAHAQEFLSTEVTPKVARIDTIFSEMKEAFNTCVKKFGYDATHRTSPDEFFGSISKFLENFSTAYKQLQYEKDEQERKLRTLPKVAGRFVNSKSQGRTNIALNYPDQRSFQEILKPPHRFGKDGAAQSDFENLIAALQSGDLFSADLERMRKSFRARERAARRTATDSK